MFNDLLVAEKNLLENCQNGEALVLENERPSEKTDSNVIRGEFLRNLILNNKQKIKLMGKDVILQIDPKGIWFSGAYISGIFDFSHCKTSLPFRFIASTFENKIKLSDSKIRFLNLHKSSIHSINAQRLICESNIFLRENFEANGEVDFSSAQIGGMLDCSNGKFDYALNCSSTIIQGAVFLRNGFKTKGEVNFISAQIGETLNCSNGKFSNENGNALNCSSTIIQGAVFLSNGFGAIGEVNFNSAQIGGSLDFYNGKFNNENGRALNCQNIKIEGNLLLDDGFEANGKVDFYSAQIGKTLILSNLTIKGDCSLTSAKIDTIREDEKFWEKDGFGKLYLDGLVYNHLSGKNFDASSRKKWLEKMPEFRPQPYKQLAKVLRNMGHNEDADEIMIEYNNKNYFGEKEENLKLNLQKLKSIVPEKIKNIFILLINKISFIAKLIYRITAGYGYKPMRVFTTMFLIWLLCGSIYWAVSEVGVFAPSDPLIFQKKEFYQCNVSADGTPILSIFNWSDYNSSNNWRANTKLDGEYTTFSPYWYSLDILLPIVDLQMDKDWGVFIPSDGLTLNHFTRWLVWFEILAGWIFSLMLVAILSGLAKNEKD